PLAAPSPRSPGELRWSPARHRAGPLSASRGRSRAGRGPASPEAPRRILRHRSSAGLHPQTASRERINTANTTKALSFYGLKWNPFTEDVPVNALLTTARLEHFFWRVENLVRDGG